MRLDETVLDFGCFFESACSRHWGCIIAKLKKVENENIVVFLPLAYRILLSLLIKIMSNWQLGESRKLLLLELLNIIADKWSRFESQF